MKILVVHNSYQQRGGEEAVVEAEAHLLQAHGHQVVRYERHNDELKSGAALGAIRAGVETVWAARSFREIRALLAKEKPDIVHFHNTLPLISPSAYYACARAGVPVVQTLHNYRLLCPAGAFLRDGKVCEDCLGRGVTWPGVVHGCYRGSRPATAAVTAMLAAHRVMRTWQTRVSVFIALSEFARGKFVQGGLPADRIAAKPNFVADGFGPKIQPGSYALYVGRLSEEKGPQLLPPAWRTMQVQVPMRIVGDGPLTDGLSHDVTASSLSQIELLGQCTPDETRSLMRDARFLVSPSICYENFPIAIAEAFASGLPVIASRIGSLEEIVRDGVTGLHFNPGDARDLAAKVEWAWSHPEELARMGQAARAEYEAKYTPERNYQMLMGIYERALASKAQQVPAPAAHTEATEQ